MKSNAVSSSGLACSVLASVLFGVVPWYVQLMAMEGNLLYFPVALFVLLTDTGFHNQLHTYEHLMLLLPGLGILCGSSMLFYIAASRKLPVSLFGLLSYLEPAVIFLVALLVLREPFSAEQTLTYGFIWLAATITSIDSIRLLRPAATT